MLSINDIYMYILNIPLIVTEPSKPTITQVRNAKALKENDNEESSSTSSEGEPPVSSMYATMWLGSQSGR